MNSRQKKILESWRLILWEFVKREWFSFFLSTGMGVLLAEGFDLLLRDHSFQCYLVSKLPSVSLDDPTHYVPYLVIVFCAVFLAVVALGFSYVRRAARSWWAGVTSGLMFLPFASAFLLSILPSSRFHHRLIVGLAAAGICFLAGFALYLKARIHAERTVREDEFTVPLSVKSLVGSALSESDDPILSWAQDALGRAALVDSLSVKIMIARAPVIALSGAFGVGKTSILNLLREHLGDKAITISFSTWLPGSQETLTSYLLADVASECKKRYVVPGLRQSARRLATALGQRVPVLSDYLKLLPSTTQKDDIENLKSALVRLPKRVVVLLDEIDRMEKEEIILRGTFKRPVKITFGELGIKYMEYAKGNKRSWLRDEQMLGKLTAFFGSERQLREIYPADIEGFKLHRRKEVSGSTVNRELALLKRMFNLAIDWDLFLGSNPVTKVRFFQEINMGFRTLTGDEEKKLLTNATPYIQDIAVFALNTGLRIGEILSLTWERVDLEKNLLSVFAHKTNKIRPVPINTGARRVLEFWALGRKNEFVFYNHETGKPFVDLKAGFSLACRKAGIEGVTWHTLRHTFASRLVGRGADIVTVQQLLGHSTVTVTMRYTHTNLDAKRNAIEKLESFSDNLVTPCTKMQQSTPKVSPIIPLKAVASYT